MAKSDKVKFSIHIDGTEYHTDQTTMTGGELKTLAGKDPQVQIFLESHGNDPDRQIGDSEGVAIKNGQHFYTIPPATMGDE
jgi:hypothetical protein